MNIKVTLVTVVTDSNGPDYVYLTLDAEPTMYPFSSPPQAKVTVASGKGAEWAQKLFPVTSGVEIDVVHT